jgi:peptide/nickel transport system permease protein
MGIFYCAWTEALSVVQDPDDAANVSFDAPWFDGDSAATGASASGSASLSSVLVASSLRQRLFGVAVAILVAALATDLLVSGGLPGLGRFPTAMDWLLAFAGLSALATGSLAFEAIPDRSTLWAAFRRRPTALVSLAFVGLFALAGSLGVLVVGAPTFDASAVFQPPAFATVDVSRVPTCYGEVTDRRCHGTMRFPLGSGPHGQSMLVLAMHGASVALKLSVVVLGVMAPIATLVGVTAGFLGGRVDLLLVRLIEVVETLPVVLVYIVAAYVVGHSLFLIAVVFALFSWASAARVVRAEAQRLRNESFVRSAASAGASDWYLVRYHVVPNVVDTVLVAALRAIPTLILAEASLSFLGLSDTQLLSWGRFIVNGIGTYFPDRFWLWGVPAAALVVTVVALDVVGDTLRAATQRSE